MCVQDLLQLASKHDCVHVVKLDVTNTAEYPILVKTVEMTLNGEGLNVLINNAGVGGRVCLEDITEDHMMEFYRINAVAPLMLVQVRVYTLMRTAVMQ